MAVAPAILGVGDQPALKLSAMVIAAFTGGTSLQLQLQGAPDNGSGAPGAYTTMWTSAAIAEASGGWCPACQHRRSRVVFGQAIPRFLKLNFISVGTHGAGTIEAQIVLDRDDQIMGTGGAYSGYPLLALLSPTNERSLP